MITKLLIVAAGGSLGTVLRFLVFVLFSADQAAKCSQARRGGPSLRVGLNLVE